jgi:thiol-disulfide isomerase/thioredoxin
MRLLQIPALCLAMSVLCLPGAGQINNPMIDSTSIPSNDPLLLNGRITTLSAFRGQKVILDFFSSSCVACFQSFPKLDSLQRKYDGKVKILLVGKLDDRIERMYRRFESKLKLQLDVVFDSLLWRHLTTQTVPTYVWLDEKGRTISITGPAEVTDRNIEQFILDGSVAPALSPGRRDLTFRNTKLLIAPGPAVSNELLHYSMISRATDSVPTYFPRQLRFSSAGPFFQALKVTQSDLYNYAYFHQTWWQPGDSLYGHVFPEPVIEDEFGDESVLKRDTTTYCYSFSTVPANQRVSVLEQAMREALENSFGYRAVIETHLLPYWGLVRIKTGDERLRSNSTQYSSQTDYDRLSLRRAPMTQLIWEIARYWFNDLPIIDQTGIDYPIDLDVDALMARQQDFLRGLHKAGLDLIKKEKLMQVVVLRKTGLGVTAMQ